MLIQSFLLIWAVLQTNPTSALGDACGQPNCTFEAFIGKEIKTGICSYRPIKEGYHDVGQQECGNGCKCYSTETKVCSASRNSTLKPIQDDLTFLRTNISEALRGLPSASLEADFCTSFNKEDCLIGEYRAVCPMTCGKPPIDCPSPWHVVGDQCLQVVIQGTHRTWSKARVYCNSQFPVTGTGRANADLAIPNNVTALYDHIKKLGLSEQDYWIGGSDLYNAGNWLYVNGSPIIGYTGDASSNGAVNECLYITTITRVGQPILHLGNEGCGASLYFVCEKHE